MTVLRGPLVFTSASKVSMLEKQKYIGRWLEILAYVVGMTWTGVGIVYVGYNQHSARRA